MNPLNWKALLISEREENTAKLLSEIKCVISAVEKLQGHMVLFGLYHSCSLFKKCFIAGVPFLVRCNLFIYQARESNLVPAEFLTA